MARREAELQSAFLRVRERDLLFPPPSTTEAASQRALPTGASRPGQAGVANAPATSLGRLLSAGPSWSDPNQPTNTNTNSGGLGAAVKPSQQHMRKVVGKLRGDDEDETRGDVAELTLGEAETVPGEAPQTMQGAVKPLNQSSSQRSGSKQLPSQTLGCNGNDLTLLASDASAAALTATTSTSLAAPLSASTSTPSTSGMMPLTPGPLTVSWAGADDANTTTTATATSTTSRLGHDEPSAAVDFEIRVDSMSVEEMPTTLVRTDRIQPYTTTYNTI